MSTPIGMSATPSAAQDLGDLARGPREQAGVRARRRRAARSSRRGCSRAQPRAVQAVVLGRRPEVPEVRLAAARQQRVAGHLVAGPLADVGARDVADVVEVEQQDRARRRDAASAASRAREAVRRAAGRRYQRSSQSTFMRRRARRTDAARSRTMDASSVHRWRTARGIAAVTWAPAVGRALTWLASTWTRCSAIGSAEPRSRVRDRRAATGRRPRSSRAMASRWHERSDATAPEYPRDGRPAAGGPPGARPQPARARRAARRLAEPHLPGRDRAARGRR